MRLSLVQGTRRQREIFIIHSYNTHRSFQVSRLTRGPTLLFPIQPAASVLADVLIPVLLCQLRGRATPHAAAAVEDDLLVRGRLLEAELVPEFFGGEEVGVRGGLDGDVDGGGDVAGLVFVGFADVWRDGVSEGDGLGVGFLNVD